jgi:hypothetical protein
MNPVAMIRQLARYPVKSMRGEALAATTLTLKGVPEDRRYAFVQAASRRDFPWLTARELPDLLRYVPTVEKNGAGETAVTVTTPTGQKWRVEDEVLRRDIEERSGRTLFLLHHGLGIYDAAPISLISRETIARIAEESGTEENFWRFRPNLLVDLQHGGDFEELNWVGRILRVGEVARIAILKVDMRCAIITLDPESGKASPRVLQCVVRQHQQRAGVYGTVITPGEVRVGDPIWAEG